MALDRVSADRGALAARDVAGEYGAVIWHLYFDGEPTLVAHICDVHRTYGRLIACDDAGPDGDCAHIQTRACDCLQPRACDPCEAYVEVMPT